MTGIMTLLGLAASLCLEFLCHLLKMMLQSYNHMSTRRRLDLKRGEMYVITRQLTSLSLFFFC